MKKLLLTLGVGIYFNITGCAGTVNLSFTPSLSDPNVIGTVVYGSQTNNYGVGVNVPNWQVRADAGTNNAVIFANLPAGMWYFTAVTYSSTAVSDHSNIVAASVPTNGTINLTIISPKP